MKRDAAIGAVIVGLVALLLFEGATYWNGEADKEMVPPATTGQEAGPIQEHSQEAEKTRPQATGGTPDGGYDEDRTTGSKPSAAETEILDHAVRPSADDGRKPNSAASSLDKKATEEVKGEELESGTNGAADRDHTRGSSYPDYDHMGTYEVTAYTAGPESTGKSPGHPAYGKTASGEMVKENHTIAADWAVLPPGTVVKIEGLDGTYTVEDSGGAINGNIIDLYIEDLAEALAWGRRNRDLWVVEWGVDHE